MPVFADFARPDPALVAAFRTQCAATVHEAMGQKGAMVSAIRSLAIGSRICGPALTVDCRPADNLAIHAAVRAGRPGDVLVVDAKALVDVGYWGDILTTAAQVGGLAGLVIDGSVRDVAVIRGMGFPVFSRGISLRGTTKVLPGAVGVAITCGGVPVAPGDIVLGDDDGVVVVPRAEAVAVLERAQERERREEEIRQRLTGGATTIDLLGLEEKLRSVGLV